MEQKEILSQAIHKYGVEKQENQCIEECAELTTALLHLRRGKCQPADVITEIADVIIMCEQMKLIYGTAIVDEEVKRKVEKLKKNLGYVSNEK